MKKKILLSSIVIWLLLLAGSCLTFAKSKAKRVDIKIMTIVNNREDSRYQNNPLEPKVANFGDSV